MVSSCAFTNQLVKRGNLSLGLPSGWAASQPLNILEEPMERKGPADIMPFEIRTWKLKYA